MKSSQVAINDTALASQYNDLREDAYGGSQLLPREQTTPDLTLRVENGVVYVNGTRVIFAGGNSPSFTAPTTNPRIDLLTIDSAGTLARVVGTEAASPTTPTYPTDKVVICEVYNRVGQTSIKTTDDGTNGYIKADVRPLVGSAIDLAQIDRDILPKTDNTYDLGSASKRWAEVRAVTLYGDGANITGLNVVRITDSFTAGEAINASTTPQAVYMKASDGKVYKTIATGDESTYKFIGFVEDGQNVNINDPVVVTLQGIVDGFSSLTINGIYYLSDLTAGAITSTAPTDRPYSIGIALTTTDLLIVKGQKIRTGADSRNRSDSGSAGNEDITITLGYRPKILRVAITATGSGGTTRYNGRCVANMINGSGLSHALGYSHIQEGANLTESNLGFTNSCQADVDGFITGTGSILSASDDGFTLRITWGGTLGGGGSRSVTVSFTWLAIG